MRSKEFIRRLLDVAQNHRTKYMWGGIGGPITQAVWVLPA